MAQLLAHQHRRPGRLQPKVGLVRQLLGYHYSRADVVSLLRLIDWIVTLPPELDKPYVEVVEQMKKEPTMAFVTSFERVYEQRGIEKGREIGLKSMLQDQIEQKFGTFPDWARQRLQQADADQLRQWARRILVAESLSAMFQEDSEG